MPTTPVQRWPGAVDAATLGRWLRRLEGRGGGSLRLAEALDVDEVLRALQPRLAPVVRGLDLIVGQCWVRRARPPHAWHQDGALNAAFTDDEPLLPILTCWLALTDCGVDAPSLEWVEPPLARLLMPADLTDDAVRARHDPAAFRQGAFGAGDALLFGGGLLHRSHVTPAMHRPRTSLELRFVDAAWRGLRLAGQARRPAFG